jgi:hypothetical protein
MIPPIIRASAAQAISLTPLHIQRTEREKIPAAIKLTQKLQIMMKLKKALY